MRKCNDLTRRLGLLPSGGTPVHVSASVSPANGEGTWSDSNGLSGTFDFFGNTAGLPPRPDTGGFFRVSALTSAPIAGGFSTLTWGAPQQNVGGGVYNQAAGTYAVAAPGLYLITSTVRWSIPAAAGSYCLNIAVGNTTRATVCEPQAVATTLFLQTISTVVQLVAGDVVSLRALQSSGGAATVVASGADNTFSVTRLR